MSVRYLLPCHCGANTPVVASQAGGSITCQACGDQIEAPRLRELRELPTESSETGATGSGWSFRLGLLTAGLFLAAGLGIGAAWLGQTEPAPPERFNAERRQAIVDQNLDVMTPAQLWDLHQNYYVPLAKIGAQLAESPRVAAQEEVVRVSRLYQVILRYAALVVLGVSALAFAVLPK